jgi:hypothetical protein
MRHHHKSRVQRYIITYDEKLKQFHTSSSFLGAPKVLLAKIWYISQTYLGEEGASSPDNDADRYVIITKLLDCILNVQRKPKSPYLRFRSLFFRKVAY